MMKGARKRGKVDNKCEEGKNIEYHCGRQRCRDREQISVLQPSDYGHELARAGRVCSTSRKGG